MRTSTRTAEHEEHGHFLAGKDRCIRLSRGCRRSSRLLMLMMPRDVQCICNLVDYGGHDLLGLVLWEVFGVDGRDERAVALPGLLGCGVGALTVLNEVVEGCVGCEGDGEEEEWVGVLAVVGRHTRESRSITSPVCRVVVGAHSSHSLLPTIHTGHGHYA